MSETRFLKTPLPYDHRDPASILRYARRLDSRSLRQAVGLSEDYVWGGRGKGSLGQAVENLFFFIENNSDSEPDFREAGLELKVTPLKETSKGLRPKERLVLNVINYETLPSEASFEASSFWRKNRRLLILFYLFRPQELFLDHVFKRVVDWGFPADDLKIIRDDWMRIFEKVRAGRAHELSEGDTLYLGACTKSSDSTVRRRQLNGPAAKPRAFSLKPRYLGHLLGLDRVDAQAILVPGRLPKAMSFEDYVVSKFRPFYGMRVSELERRFNVASAAKQKDHILARKMLGIKSDRIAEFEKAEVKLKTIRLLPSGRPKEAMSFKNIPFVDIVGQGWEDSTFYDELTHRFFFFVIRFDESREAYFDKVMFWSMPHADLEVVRKVWEDTKRRIAHGDYEHFIRSSDDRISHVRPKGRDARDLAATPQGGKAKKKCFWLNQQYIQAQVAGDAARP